MIGKFIFSHFLLKYNFLFRFLLYFQESQKCIRNIKNETNNGKNHICLIMFDIFGKFSSKIDRRSVNGKYSIE